MFAWDGDRGMGSGWQEAAPGPDSRLSVRPEDGMTDLLYMTDAYLRDFEATVTAVNGQEVILDRTAFYPGGGGQPHDLGRLSSADRAWEVGDLYARRREESGTSWRGTSRRRGAGPRRLGLGAPLPLDAHAHRHAHPVRRDLAGLWGKRHRRQHGALRGRMDFEFETMRQELVREIEEKSTMRSGRPARFAPRSSCVRRRSRSRT